MNTTESDYSYERVSNLSREAHRLARLRYSDEWQHHLLKLWGARIDKVQTSGTVEGQCRELETIIERLKG